MTLRGWEGLVTLRPILRDGYSDIVRATLAGEFKDSEEFCDSESRSIKE